MNHRCQQTPKNTQSAEKNCALFVFRSTEEGKMTEIYMDKETRERRERLTIEAKKRFNHNWYRGHGKSEEEARKLAYGK